PDPSSAVSDPMTTPDPTNQPPTARLDSEACTELGEWVPIDASNSTDPDDDSLSYSWDVPTGGGGTVRGSVRHETDASVRVKYRDSTADLGWHADRIPIRVTVTDEHGATDIATTHLKVFNGGLGSVLCTEPPSVVRTGERLELRARTPPNADSLSYAWNFTGGSNGTVSVAATRGPDNHTLVLNYTDGPNDVEWNRTNQTVTLTVTNEYGHTAIETRTFTVVNAPSGSGNQAPTARIEAPASVVWGQRFQVFGTNSSDPEGDALSYEWDFGRKEGLKYLDSQTPGRFRGRYVTGSDENSRNLQVGITLTVTDEHGLTDTARTTIQIRDDRLLVLGIGIGVVPASETLPVEAGQKASIVASPGRITEEWLTYEWNLDGGRVVGGEDDLKDGGGNVVWDEPGEKTITVTVTTPWGTSQTVRRTITVTPAE
ncbi:MAG: PKD domain-containing protein, partial [Haloarculaceae archaeon]